MSDSDSRLLEEILAAAEKELLQVPREPDIATRLEEQGYKLERVRTKLAKARLRSLKQNIRERKRYAGRTFWLMTGWVVAMLLMLLSEGFHLLGFSLSQPVLLTAIGSTSAEVLGLFYIIAHYLFPTHKRNPSKKAVPHRALPAGRHKGLPAPRNTAVHEEE